MSLRLEPKDHTGAFAEAFFIANLLFVGVFYVVLWALYLIKNQDASPVNQNHLKQALIASSITTFIFLLINAFIILTTGYATASALFCLELYFMIILPLFLILGIIGFAKAVKQQDFLFPIIGKLVSTPTP